MSTTLCPFLMFVGRAEEALNFYVSLFEDGEILRIERYGPEQPDREGTVTQALFRVAGQEIMAIDSPPVHQFGFTPSVSLFVTCGGEEEFSRLAAALGEGGAMLMPPGEYGFSRKFCWLNDRFGLSWQLNLP
jgi:predicted 3-demethylubiquinone-9 3-methyltransferase (glyoxalase superfamily)